MQGAVEIGTCEEHPAMHDVSVKKPHLAAHRGAGTAAPVELNRTLLDVSRSTASHRDLPSLLRDLRRVLRGVARFDRLALVLHDPARDVMCLHTIAAAHPALRTTVELPPPESPSGVAWQTQRPVVVSSVARDTRFPRVAELLAAEGMRSCCILPLTSPLRRLGALGFASAEEDAFTDADVELLQQLTSQVALAVDNVLHHETAQRAQQELARERDRLQLLLEVNNALVSNLEPRALFRAIATCLRRVVSHDYTSLTVYDARRNAFDMWAIEFAGKGFVKEHMSVPLEGSPAGAAFTAGRPVRLARADLERLSADIARLLLAEDIQSMCCVPLTVHDRRLGTLNVGRFGSEPFTAEDADLLAAVANQVAFSVESALFGHERGAFTGAIAQKIGRFELADGGTIFLDEVGDIPLELQPKLLRVLQEQEFERLGSTRTKRVDVRVVAATNRNLEEMVAAGTFRNDLYYRLNVFPITVPALRERAEDIPALVRYFVQKFARRMKKRIETIPADAMAALCRYAWPGNVRELENAIERAVILTSGLALRVPASEFPTRVVPPSGDGTLEATEREAVVRTLRATNGVLGGPHGAAPRLPRSIGGRAPTGHPAAVSAR